MATLIRKRLRRDEGAALLEFAFIAPVLFLILFGMIDFGFIYNDFLSVRQGVRDGARQGAVANFGSNTGCTTSAGAGPIILSGSTASSNEAQELICTTRDRIGLDASKMRVAVTLGGAYQDGTELVVCAMYPATSRTGFLTSFIGNGAVTTRVAIRIEQTGNEIGLPTADDLGQPTGQARYDYWEQPLSGKNWGFCNP